MAIDQEIAARGVLILAYGRFRDQGVFQGRESMRDIRSCLHGGFRSGQSRLRVWLDALPVTIERQLQPGKLNIWHAINFVALKQPRGQRWRREALVAGRATKEEH